MKKEIVNELFWLRSLSCLAVVLLHSIAASSYNFPENNQELANLFKQLSLFGTPTFVFISIFLISKFYPNGTPTGFLTKRFKYLLFPYVFMALIYAIFDTYFALGHFNNAQYLKEVLKNIVFGDYIAWFIPLILQLYILYSLVHKFLDKISPVVIIPLSLLINIIYLLYFSITKPLGIIPFSDYIWYRGYWILFFGWIFYFVAGYYAAKHFKQYIEFVKKHIKTIVLITIFSSILLVSLTHFNIISAISTKRPDVLIYTSGMISIIIYISTKINNIPKFIVLVNNYSFSIYLLHSLFIYSIDPLPFMNQLTYTITIFILSALFSIIVAHIVNKIPIGKYLVGNVQTQKKKRKKQTTEKYLTTK
ncbi:acyltransferase family protein [Priestia megaterium]|uniref:acyltransferase family protein n=1 Tax=Priestia aryabhattai TaxID=412384 RepID=UPI0027E47732|nr:acyltransferase family protein [Priestia aryabhattai]MCG0045538.1 acyltransferase family protein [Priestia aryabhattai]